MNWKRQEYKIGDIVCIVKKYHYTHKNEITDGEVIHAGTKLLKVKIGSRIYTFKNTNYCKGAMYGVYYYVYKSKDEYENIIQEQVLRKELEDELIRLLPYISKEDLQDILDKYKR